MAKLLVIGGGKMGEALVAGLIVSGWASPAEIIVVEREAARREQLVASGGLAGRHQGLRVVPAVRPDAEPVEGAVLAVKPADAQEACRSLATAGAKRVLSVVAGVVLGDLEQWCPQDCAVVRAMPNTGVMVRAGAAAIAPGTHAQRADMDWATGILGSVGTVVEVPEDLLDAVTGLSGSGPAYVFLLVEAMVEAGVAMGLPRPLAHALVVQTLFGAARLLQETGQSPEALRAAVTSPGGTTAAGLRALEAGRARSVVIEAVAAATERSRQMRSAGGRPA
ncbi:MAG: pyrroline-5-carboxylate reductase [Acidimicrobiales bacterium]